MTALLESIINAANSNYYSSYLGYCYKMASRSKSKRFVRPNSKEVIAAIGLEDNMDRFMEFLRKCSELTQLEVDLDGNILFPQIELPGADDWLRNFPTEPEPFYKWQKKIRNHVLPRVRTIYILPLGEFAATGKASGKTKEASAKVDTVGKVFLHDLETYAQLFFPGMIVKLLKEVPLSKLKCRSRHHTVDDGVTREQLMIPGIFEYMKSTLPRDAYCMLAVTMIDLYPNEDYNFVFGRASLLDGIGVFSFARHHPYFFDKDKDVSVASLNELSPEEYQLLQWRAIKVLTHEICHMFGLKHCVYFTCLMNGSNHAEESDRKLTFLCPVCLRKMQDAIKFDFLARYKGLLTFFQGKIISADNKTDRFFYCTQWLEKAIAIA